MDSMGTMTMAMPTASIASAATGAGKGMASMPAMTGMPSMPGIEGMDMTCKISMLWNWYTIDSCFLASSWHVRSHGMFAGSCIGVICLVLVLELLRRVGREYDAFILRRARLTRMYMPGPSVASDPSEAGNITYQSVSTDDTASKATDCDRCCKALPYATSQDDAISTAPESSSNTKPPKHNVVFTGTPILTGPLPQRSGVLDPYRPSIVEQIVRALLHMLQFAVAYIIMLFAMYFNGYIIICIFIGAFLGSLIFSWEPVSLNKENDACQVTKCCG